MYAIIWKRSLILKALVWIINERNMDVIESLAEKILFDLFLLITYHLESITTKFCWEVVMKMILDFCFRMELSSK